MPSHNRIKRGFNLLSSTYGFFSRLFFGGLLQTSQHHFLRTATPVKSALIFGGGNGDILVEALRLNLAGTYCYVDLSNSMVDLARQKAHHQFPEQSSHITFIEGSYGDIPSDVRFDTIITAYVLDCFSEAELYQVLQKLDSTLHRTGQFLFTDFNVPAKPFMLNLLFGAVVKVLYIGFHLVCGLGIFKLPDFQSAFKKLGYEAVAEKKWVNGLLVSRCYKRSDNQTTEP